MREIKITDYHFKSFFLTLGKDFSTKVEEECDEYILHFDNNIGKGSIKGINLSYGVGAFMIDAKFNEDIRFSFSLGRRHPILFINNYSDELTLQTKVDNLSHDLQSHEAMIYAPDGSNVYSLNIKKGSHAKFAFVSVIRFLFLRKIECDIYTLPKILRKMLKDTTGSQAFYFKTSSEPVNANNLSRLFSESHLGLERKLLIEGVALKLITDLTRTFRVESTSKFSNYRFKQTDIENLNAAKNYIIDNIDEEITVNKLALKFGMNTNKIQKGFRLLFDKSIRQFIISMKMHMALDLIENTELSLSQISSQLGYINKSHFTSLFKKEFGVLPSKFRNIIKVS